MVKNNKITVKQNILENAAQIFAKFGYQKTSTTDIAKAMGKTKAFLYYYFKDKEELFSQIIEIEANKYIQILKNNVDFNFSTEKNIEIYITFRSKYFRELSNKFSSLKSELLGFLPIIEEIRTPYHKSEIELVYNILKGKEAQIDETSELYKKAEIIVNINKALEIPLFARTGVIDIEFDINKFIELINDGLTKNK